MKIPFGGYPSVDDCRDLQSPSYTVGTLSQRTDALAVQLETPPWDAQGWSPVGTYRVDEKHGTTAEEGHKRNISPPQRARNSLPKLSYSSKND